MALVYIICENTAYKVTRGVWRKSVSKMCNVSLPLYVATQSMEEYPFYHLEKAIKDLMDFYRRTWPNETITPKLPKLEEPRSWVYKEVGCCFWVIWGTT